MFVDDYEDVSFQVNVHVCDSEMEVTKRAITNEAMREKRHGEQTSKARHKTATVMMMMMMMLVKMVVMMMVVLIFVFSFAATTHFP